MILTVLIGLYVLAVVLSKRRIYEHGKPYIDRWYVTPCVRWFIIFGFKFQDRRHGLLLQHILKRDDNAHLHNHPWEATSLILWGEYFETRRVGFGSAVGVRRLGPGSINRLGRDVFHRIHRVGPHGAWTLLWHGKRVRDWGFSVNGRFVNHEHPKGRGRQPEVS